MTNEERWDAFIVELRAYIEEHHHGANKHTDLYNRTRYYRRKMKEGSLPEDKAKALEEIRENTAYLKSIAEALAAEGEG